MYMLIGPTGSGKTTYRQANLSKIPCVSPDDFIVGKWTPEKAREAWSYAYTVANRLFVEGTDFVVDAQFVNAGTRGDWVKKAKLFNFIVNAIVIDTPLEQILANHKARGDRGGYGEIPIYVVQQAYKSFKNLYDSIINAPANFLERFNDIKIIKWDDQSTGWKHITKG